jgi:AraC-like DNA-binding protein
VQVARLRDAMRNDVEMSVIADAREFDRIARDNVCVPNLVVVSGEPTAAANNLRRIRQAFGAHLAIAFVAYLETGREPSPNLGALAAAGVHQILFAGINDSASVLRAVFQAAQHQSAADAVMCAMQPSVPEALHPMLEAALSRPADISDVRRLADALGVTRKTLFKRCERTHFINPAELLQWTRIALVAHLLDVSGCTVETLANELGFASPTALRNAIKRYTGRRALDLRSDGALITVAHLFSRRARVH